MAALKRHIEMPTTLQRLQYWRGIRLDFPSRKAEAMRNIDVLLDILLTEEKADDGA